MEITQVNFFLLSLFSVFSHRHRCGKTNLYLGSFNWGSNNFNSFLKRNPKQNFECINYCTKKNPNSNQKDTNKRTTPPNKTKTRGNSPKLQTTSKFSVQGNSLYKYKNKTVSLVRFSQSRKSKVMKRRS